MSFVYFFVPAAARPLKVMRTTENLPKDWWFFFIHTHTVLIIRRDILFPLELAALHDTHTHTRVVQYYYYYFNIYVADGAKLL